MTIDHGLGGRDGVKSKQRREKKARKQKIVATKAITGGKKKEVIFDEKARVEWLSGFHKRKQERRKYGLAMEVMLRKLYSARFLPTYFAPLITERFTSIGLEEAQGTQGDVKRAADCV
jgi:hypothetical protein